MPKSNRDFTIRRVVLCVCIAFQWALGLGCATTDQGGRSGRWQYYGHEFPNSGAVCRIDELKGGKKSIIVEGAIGEVCQSMGCWLVLRDDYGQELFVQTRDHSFFVPRNASGHRARAWGEAEFSEVSVESLRHFARDAGRSEAEIDAIQAPIHRITFYADSIVILGDGLEPAEPPVHQR